jgi:hypothetical protein
MLATMAAIPSRTASGRKTGVFSIFDVFETKLGGEGGMVTELGVEVEIRGRPTRLLASSGLSRRGSDMAAVPRASELAGRWGSRGGLEWQLVAAGGWLQAIEFPGHLKQPGCLRLIWAYKISFFARNPELGRPR